MNGSFSTQKPFQFGFIITACHFFKSDHLLRNDFFFNKKYLFKTFTCISRHVRTVISNPKNHKKHDHNLEVRPAKVYITIIFKNHKLTNKGYFS